MWNQAINFPAAGRAATLYLPRRAGAPLIVLHNFSESGDGVIRAMRDVGCADGAILCISKLNWDQDMTPWYCPPLAENDTPCTGGADAYLRILLEEILPAALSRLEGRPAFLGIAGYSLAGLFALYAMCQTDCFSRVASMSGSLWFPDFVEYAESHAPERPPERIYLSLGDEEARTRHPLLRTVRENTERLAAHYRGLGIPTECVWNPGNHFQDAALRSAKGIAALLA